MRGVVEVRTIVEREMDAYSTAVLEGFHKLPGPGDVEFQRPLIEVDRTYGAFDGASVVGTARTSPFGYGRR